MNKKDLTWFIENLPERFIRHKVSDTDYIHVDVKELKGENGWYKDMYDRYIILYNGTILFQRYSNNQQLLMVSEDGITFKEYN